MILSFTFESKDLVT